MVTATVDTVGKSSQSTSFLSAKYDSAIPWYVVFVIIALAYYLLYFNYGIDLDDEGFVIGGASAIAFGNFPLADFLSYPPWMYFSLAGFFQLFGETLRVEHIFLMLHLLVGIVCLLWLSRKVLPPLPALIPVLFYLVAPGSWYRVFFVSAIILVTVALFYFNDRPSPRRALVLGFAIGFAAINRVEVAAVSVVVVVVVLATLAFCDLRVRQTLGVIVSRLLTNAATCAVGTAVPLLLMIIPYAMTGKLQALLANVVRYINPTSYADGVVGRGLDDMFRPIELVLHPRLEQWVYAVAMMACVALLLINAAMLLRSTPDRFVELRRKILLAAMGVASMGETFFFVWNSRMLSTFAIVTLAVVTLSYDLSKLVAPRWRAAAFAVPCIVIGCVIVVFARAVDYYSGSITVRGFTRHSSAYRQTTVPFLKGAMIWRPQAETIDQLYRVAQEHPDATLVPMTYCTTLGYLSGLRNPTYFRLFTNSEMPGKQGQEAAVKTFEQYKIDYFVGRRGAFFTNDDPGAVQMASLPLVKDYLLRHYDIEPLGENYVILVRRRNL
jgi:hypothetical protein